MKVQEKNVAELNDALQQYFRASKRIRINARKGIFVVVDDRQEMIDYIKKMIFIQDENQKVIGESNVEDAQKTIESNDIRAVVIDIGLDGDANNTNGFILADWLNDEYPDVPFLFATGKKKMVKEIESRFPGVDIFIKGKHNTDDFICALGLDEDSCVTETDTLPVDLEMAGETKKSSAFSFFKGILQF
jgi:CheY-like chemotaxis protein